MAVTIKSPYRIQQGKVRSDTFLIPIFYWMLFLTALVIGLLTASDVLAIGLQAELSAGYNDNTYRTDREKGSGFTFYGLEINHQFTLAKSWTLDTLLLATYQDYEKVKDNYLLQSGAALSRPLAGGRIFPSLLIEANAYRDDLIKEDDRNEVMTGIQINWVLSRHLSLNTKQTLRWLDYRNWTKPFGVRGYDRTEDPPSPAESRRAYFRRRLEENVYSDLSFSKNAENDSPVNPVRPRDDRIYHTGIGFDMFLPHTVTCSVCTGYTKLHASLKIESYKQINIVTSLSWQPSDKWLVELDGAWYRTKYYKATGVFKTTTYTRSIGIQCRRFFGKLELFGQFVWTDNNSSLGFENYNQAVTQCGISWSF